MAIDAVPSPTAVTPVASEAPKSASARERLDVMFAPAAALPLFAS